MKLRKHVSGLLWPQRWLTGLGALYKKGARQHTGGAETDPGAELSYLMPWHSCLLLLRGLGPQIPHRMTSNIAYMVPPRHQESETFAQGPVPLPIQKSRTLSQPCLDRQTRAGSTLCGEECARHAQSMAEEVRDHLPGIAALHS